jgi:nitrate/TMAO reductase-like tetraheme cytochrome c subunit
VKKKNKMNSNKVALMLIAILAVGIFALPSTVSLFGGQHKWYDLGPTDNNIPCTKCHADTYVEFSGTGVHAMLGSGLASNDSDNITAPNDACMYCHRTGSATFAKGDTSAATPGEEAHAASAVACMYCHEYQPDFDLVNVTDELLAPGFFAGGFRDMSTNTTSNFSYTNSSATGYTPGSLAAHNEFIEGAIDDSMMTDSNEACIACHTYVAIDINWTHSYKMYFEADGRGGLWDVTNFDSEGCYNTTTYGNMSGGTYNATSPVISISPAPYGYDSLNP